MKFKGRIVISIIYTLFLFFPFFYFLRDFGGTIDLKVLFDERTVSILKNSTVQALCSTIFSLIISIMPALYIARKKGIIAKLIEQTIFIPFFFPVITTVISFSIVYTISPHWIQKLFFYNLTSVVLAHTFYNSPIFVKYIGDSLKKIPNEIIEAGKTDGASGARLFFLVELPMIKSSIMRAAFMVFVYSFTSFAVVLSMGGIKYSTFETAIAATLNSDLDFSRALVYGIIQFLFIKVLSLILNRENRDEESHEIYNRERNVGKIASVGAVVFLIFEYFIVCTAVLSSFYNFYIMKFDFSGITTIFGKTLNSEYKIIESLFNSTIISLITAVCVTLIAYFLLKWRTKFTDSVVMGAMGISTTLFAIVLYYTNILFGIPYMLLIIAGYIMTMVPISYSYMHRYVAGFDMSIIEAAKTDGAGVCALFFLIELPILLPLFIGSILQIFAVAFGEFTIVYTMQIVDYIPVSSVVNYSLFSQRRYMEGSALSIINVAVIFVLFYISNRILLENKKIEIKEGK